MRIGVDFDNTIVCYDQVFHQVALERGLIPKTTAVSKGAVRDCLRQADREDDWTELQGYVYGERMCDAQPFPGVLDFFGRMVAARIPICIISHKTKHPYRGPRYDLHAAALGWLEQNGFFDAARIGIPRKEVYLELTLAEKLARITKARCTHFIDDLPELLSESDFPNSVRPMLFDPADAHSHVPQFRRVNSWTAMTGALRAA
jgi:hypothetical protein